MENDSAAPVERIARTRSFADKFICSTNDIWYSVYESTMLKLARSINEQRYATQKFSDNPLVSVYIPTYNRVDLLSERGVPSVLNQTYKNFELIVVGDCCTDGTEKYVSSLGDPRVKFFNIAKRGFRYPDRVELHWLAGPVVAANQALKMVRGDWIARLDDDDIWTPDHLEKLLTEALRCRYEFVSAQSIVERDGKKYVESGNGPLDPYHSRKPAPGPEVYNPRIGGTATWLYRSYLKFIKYNIHCWRKEWNRVNDIDISIRMFEAGVNMGFLADVVTYILPRPGEKTVGIDAYMRDAERKHQQYSFSN